jgi:RNA polymerase sigma-54 factor
VRKIDNRWQVEISASGVPKLSVNQQYAKLLRGNGDHAVLKTQLQEARWLVRSLEIRNETLLKVATSIVSRQTEFLDRGDKAMKPLVLKDVAEAIGMHESTISRVTTNKYMHTPRGVFEFKYFFSSHLSSIDGEDQSSTSVRAKIKKLIGAENPAKPLSDSKLAKLLAKEGITVARRTVAKYRESLKIASSSERRVREPK